MNPTRPCPRCGRQNLVAHSFCSSCGGSLSAPANKNAWKLILGVLALFAGALWVTAVYTSPNRESDPPQLPGKVALLAADAPAASPASQPQELTSTQHLAEARRALAEGYKPNKDTKKASWGEVAAAKWHLKAISQGAAEYSEAQELLKEVARRERQIELAAKPAPSPTPKAADTEVEDTASADSLASPATPPQAPKAPNTARQPGLGRAGDGTTTGGSSSSDFYTNVDGVQVRRPVPSAGGPPTGATAQCRDGSYSFSLNRRGTCSHHGGVARWL